MAFLEIAQEIENTLQKLNYKIKEKKIYEDGFIIDSEKRVGNARYVITVSSKYNIIDFIQAVYEDPYETIHIIFTIYRYTIILKIKRAPEINLSMTGDFRKTLSEAMSLENLINFIHVFTEPPAGTKGTRRRASFVKDIIKQILDKT
jgi:hypothetical protein